MFKNGVRQRDCTLKETPVFSARLLPNFNRRQNIKDMFTRRPSLLTAAISINSDDNRTKPPSHSPNDSAALSSSDRSLTNGDASQKMGGLMDSSQESAKLQSPERKRPAPSPSPVQTAKRSKSTATNKSALVLAKGQKSLKGFFKSKTVEKTMEVSDDLLTEKAAKEI